MKLVQAGYRIDDMPDGDAALAKIERLGRIAYKSEGLIDDGRVRCEGCDIMAEARGGDRNFECACCGGSGWLQVREPSSHKFVKKILQAERKAKMIIDTELYLRDAPITHSNQRRANELVDNIVSYMQQNPAHESVIEHCSATVVFTTNVGVTHELVRHRIASYTQESTRYCAYNKDKFDNQVSFIERVFWGKVTDEEKIKAGFAVWRKVMETSEWGYLELLRLGFEPQIARDCLTKATKTEIATTANFREWRTIFGLRAVERAHPDMWRALMVPLRYEFRKRIPIIFDE
jgi:thymidylate synthase (FAD)